MFQSTEIIGQNQFRKAQELYESASTALQGTVGFIHTYVDFSNVTVSSEFTSNGQTGYTCSASLGDSFAAGTTDGPGDFDFVQGTNSTSTNPYWNFIAQFLSEPTAQEIACQAPKPILLNTGDMTLPAPWTAKILPIQMFRIGQLVIVGVPGEFTTMSGRRLRNTVLQTLIANGAADNDTVIVIAGLSNAYSHYITTFEEFSFQRYEGASTLYGPHTLAAYQQEFSKLATAFALGKSYPPGPTPPDLSYNTYDFLPPVIVDEPPIFGSFGQVYSDVKADYELGDIVTVIFYGANPRSDFKTQQTFLTVEMIDNGVWTVIATDGDWETKFMWQRHYLAESLITITWEIPENTTPGTYRIRTFGSSKDILGNLTPYQGTSSVFIVN